MERNLDSYTLVGRAIALPARRANALATRRRTPSKTLTPFAELEKARTAAVRPSRGEQLAWLAMVLSALAVLGLSAWF